MVHVESLGMSYRHAELTTLTFEGQLFSTPTKAVPDL
jgi:hypothetical protein